MLKHVNGRTEKVNAVKYLTIPPPTVEESFYEEDVYEVNDQTEGFGPNSQVSKMDNWG